MAFAIAMVLLAGTGAVSYRNLLVMIETNRERSRADHFLDADDTVQSNLSRAAGARRGFVITGDAANRARFEAALAGLNEGVSALSALAGDDGQAATVRELRPLLERRVELLRKSFEPGGASPSREAQIRITREEQELGDQIRAVLGRLKSAELRNLAGREAEVDRQARQAVLLSATGSIAALIMLVGAGYLVRQGRAALAESEGRNRSIVETAAVGILSVDPRGTVEFANPACERLFGRPADELVGRPMDRFIAPAATPGTPGGRGAAAARGDGSRIPVEVSISERPFGAAGLRTVVVADVSEREAAERRNRRLQAELAQAQRLEALGRLAGGVAHDFNSLLTGILWFADTAAADLPAGSKPAEDVAEIRRTAERAGGLVRQLLAFARGQSVEPQRVEPDAAIPAMLPLLRGMCGDTVTLEFEPGGAPAVRIDPGQFEQIVTNLVTNARDAMPNGGRAAIRTRSAAPGGENGAAAVLEVSDSGGGMDEATRSRMFEPFFTTKDPGKGTGLGLAVVHGIVHQAGGRIEVDSAPGAGTTLRVYLPADGSEGASPAG